MTHLVRVRKRLARHDEGMDDARADREPNEAAMLGRIASGIDQKCTQHGIYPANHLQVKPAFTPMPYPPRGPNQTKWINQEEDYAEDDKRGFEQHFAGGVVHLDSPIFQRRQSSPSFFGLATQPSRTCSAPHRGPTSDDPVNLLPITRLRVAESRV